MRNRTQVWIVQHPTEPVLLVRGRPMGEVAALLSAAGAADVARWSDLGAGWVVPEQFHAAIETASEATNSVLRTRLRGGER